MLHIMVVDDEAPIRDWLVYCIQKCEAASSVTSAVNGEEAYRRILEQKPNVVFTDIRMPGMDGLELMSKVRDILPFTVFIILTNYAEFSYAKQAISLGAREYILKSEMRSSDIQRIVAEIAATTAKIRSEKVHDVLQDGVVDLYEMYRNFGTARRCGRLLAAAGAAARPALSGLLRGQRQQPGPAAADGGPGLASRAPFSVAAMVQEHLYLLPSSARRRRPCGAMPWTRRPPWGVPPARRRVRPVHRHRPAHPCAGEAAAAQEACFFTGGGVVPYLPFTACPPH